MQVSPTINISTHKQYLKNQLQTNAHEKSKPIHK